MCFLQDNEVMRVWLRDLHFEEYCILFVQAGYDMPTISHMTPQVQILNISCFVFCQHTGNTINEIN